MSTKIESTIRQISYPQASVYAMLSDLSNIDRVRDRLPEDKIKDLSFDTDSISISTQMGAVKLVIVEREAPKTIKFAADGSPIEVNMWIQLVEKEENLTKMRLTLKADLPMMVKMMVDGKLKDGINKVADVLANLNYE